MLVLAVALAAGFAPVRAHANGRFPESLRLMEYPGNPDRLYLGATYGLLVTEDRGKSWYSICEQAFALQYVEGDPLLEVLPDGTVLAGIYETLNRSSDCGCGWQTVLGSGPKQTVWDIAQGAPGTVLALVKDSTTLPARSSVHESTDGGKTWNKLSDLPVEIVDSYTLDIAASDPTRIYVSGVSVTADKSQGEILVSKNHGTSWTRVALPGTTTGALPYIAAVDTKNADRVYVRTDLWVDDADPAADDALMMSSDGGATWTEILRRGGKLLGFALSPDGNTILAGYGDPLQAGGRSVNSDDLGIYKAAVSVPMGFEKIYSGAISCLRWTATGVYACITEKNPDVPRPGLGLGFAPNAGFTSATAAPFSSLLSLKNVKGPLACAAATCLESWQMATTDVPVAVCDQLAANCSVNATANVLSCAAATGAAGTGGSGAGGSGGGTAGSPGGGAGGTTGAAGSGTGGASAGTGGGGNKSGCGCSVPDPRPGGAITALLGLAVLLVSGRRRRGSTFVLLAVIGFGSFAGLGCGGEGAPAVMQASCEGRGDMFFAGIAKTSADAAVSVTLTSAAPAPPANSYTNKWTLQVTDATSTLMLGAMVVAAPYMVDHGHGAPSVFATEGDAGIYVVDPLSLKMNGLWDVTIKVVPADAAGAAESRVVFSFCVMPI